MLTAVLVQVPAWAIRYIHQFKTTRSYDDFREAQADACARLGGQTCSMYSNIRTEK